MSKGPYTEEQIRQMAEHYDVDKLPVRNYEEAPEVQPLGYYYVESRPNAFQQWVAKVFLGMKWMDYTE